MDLMNAFFLQKNKARRELLSRIHDILANIQEQACLIVADQQKRIMSSIQDLDEHKISIFLTELAIKPHQHLVDTLQHFISALQRLAQALIQRSQPHTEANPQIQAKKIQIKYSNSILDSQISPPVRLATTVSPQKETKINQKQVNLSHSLIANPKPVSSNTTGKRTQTLSNIQSKQKQAHLNQPKVEVTQFSAKIGENYELLKNIYHKASKQERKICAQSCLQLDSKIYDQASDYLAQVKSKNKGGYNSRSLFSKSPKSQKTRLN